MNVNDMATQCCVQVEVAVLSSPSRIDLMISVDLNATTPQSSGAV